MARKISKAEQKRNEEYQRRRAIADRVWEVLRIEFLIPSYKSLRLIKIDDIIERLKDEYSPGQIEDGLRLLRHIPGTITLRITAPGTARALGLNLYACGAKLKCYGFIRFEDIEQGGLFDPSLIPLHNPGVRIS